MKGRLKGSIYSLLLVGALVLLLSGCGSTSKNSVSANKSLSGTQPGALVGLLLSGYSRTPKNSASTDHARSGGPTGDYYVATDNYGVEWVIVYPYTLSSNQNYYVEFPAVILQYPGTYQSYIPGQWELINNSSYVVAYVLQSPPASNTNYAAYANYLNASSFATQVETSEENIWSDVYAQDQVSAIDSNEVIPSASDADTPIDDGSGG